ncbi:hypothetical protein D3C81_1466300 [compost metagenome]
MLEQTVADILDVERPFFHIFVVQQVKHRYKMVDRFLNSNLRRLVLAFDDPPDLAHKDGILQDSQVSVKDAGFLRTHRLFNLVLHHFDFGFRRANAFVQPLEFFSEIHLFHPAIRYVPFPGGQHESFADGDASCCSDPLYHVVTP